MYRRVNLNVCLFLSFLWEHNTSIRILSPLWRANYCWTHRVLFRMFSEARDKSAWIPLLFDSFVNDVNLSQDAAHQTMVQGALLFENFWTFREHFYKIKNVLKGALRLIHFRSRFQIAHIARILWWRVSYHWVNTYLWNLPNVGQGWDARAKISFPAMHAQVFRQLLCYKRRRWSTNTQRMSL